MSQSRPAALPADLYPLLPSEDCDAPCWQGIQPPKASQMELVTAINRLPDVREIDKNTWGFAGHTLRVNSDTGDLFILPHDLTLGEWVLAMGVPDYQTVQVSVAGRMIENEQVLQLFYEEAQVTVFMTLPSDRLSIHTPINTIRYGVIAPPFNKTAWQGWVYTKTLPSPFETGKK